MGWWVARSIEWKLITEIEWLIGVRILAVSLLTWTD